MRRLTKGEKPEILKRREQPWTKEYMAAVANDVRPRPTRWKHHEIRDALRQETSERCAYCEGRITHVTYDEIEHIFPKAHRPDLVVQWLNLTLACPRCNNEKRDYYEPTAPLVHPYDDSPETHIHFRGSLALPAPGDEKGRRTIAKMRLYRAELTQARETRISQIHQMLEIWMAASAPDKDTLAAVIREDVEQGEYTACATAHLRSYAFPI